MNVEELEARIRTLEDIEEIKKLQRTYGYYLDHGMFSDIIDLFSDNMESVEVADHGVFLGKEGARKFFNIIMGKEGRKPPPELSLHLHMQHQGVVDLAKDGTAKGRWQCWIVGVQTVAGTIRQVWGHGVYENEYVKEGRQWKFKKLYFNLTFQTPYEDGWLKTPVISRTKDYTVKPDKPSTAYYPYPSGYVVPYHWKNPMSNEEE
jgi:hypothetical protein